MPLPFTPLTLQFGALLSQLYVGSTASAFEPFAACAVAEWCLRACTALTALFLQEAINDGGTFFIVVS